MGVVMLTLLALSEREKGIPTMYDPFPSSHLVCKTNSGGITLHSWGSRASEWLGDVSKVDVESGPSVPDATVSTLPEHTFKSGRSTFAILFQNMYTFKKKSKCLKLFI